MTREKFTTYADMSDDLRLEVVRSYQDAIRMGSDPGHAAACAAHNVLCRYSQRAWGGKKGENAWAATLGVLVMYGQVSLTDLTDGTIRKSFSASRKG